ncbi:hypothetical protein V8B97DRAFT_2026922 [Scleroderma yunnanense]
MLQSIGRTTSSVAFFNQLRPEEQSSCNTAPWAITPDDITTPSEVLWSPDNVPQASTSKTNDSPDYSNFFPLVSYFTEVGIGDIPWLFQPDFCDFTKIHLGFNVSVQFTLVSLSKCIIWTAYPNQFCVCEDQDLAFTPPAKIPCIVLEVFSLKHKVCKDQDLVLAPSSKITYMALKAEDIANLSFITMHRCFVWQLPNELLNLTATLLPCDSLPVLMQVCKLFREITTPHYFVLLKFRIPCDDFPCEALLVWQHTDVFIVPPYFHLAVSQTTTDHQFYALQIFFKLLTGVVPQVQLFLYGGPYEPTLALLCLLKSIQGSSCKELGCHGITLLGEAPQTCHVGRVPNCESELQDLELASSLFFTPMIISFTISTLQNAPLVRLTLTNTGLNVAQWTDFLKNLDLRYLQELEVETICPPQKVNTLTICHSVKLQHSALIPPCLSPSCYPHSMMPLDSLNKLNGSPAYILALLHYTIPDVFLYLEVQLEQSSLGDSFLSDILSCAEQIPGLDPHALTFPENDLQTCLVKELSFQIQDSEMNYSTLVSFLEIRDLHLYTHSSTSDSGLEGIFHSFSPSSTLRVSIMKL